MYRVLLLDQWNLIRLPLALACIAGFAFPVMSVQLASTDMGYQWTTALLADQVAWGTAYPLLAAALGLLLGTAAWRRDHRGDHVYAMSLPIKRSHYALLKFGVGILLVMPVVIAVGAGTISATFAATIPEGLSAYPIALTIRFGMTSMMAFAVFFAISSGTARTAGFVLGPVAFVAVTLFFLTSMSLEYKIVQPFLSWVLGSVSPLGAFGGRWMLIDV